MAIDAPSSDDADFRKQLEQDRQQTGVEFDAIVVGTGFGGAVTACRLVEAGFKVCMLERGRRYGRDDFPKYPVEDLFSNSDDSGAAPQQFTPPPDFSRWLWSQDHGLYDVRDLGDGVVVQAAGYGGGSLIYVNVHLRPPYSLFDEWPKEYAGTQLAQYFDLAAYMLGATPIPQRLAKTLQLQRAAEQHPGSFFRPPLAINFTEAGLNRHGREQNPCDMRARCWRGCDHQAKNTLDLNYLAIAENHGCTIMTLAEVTKVRRTDSHFIVEYEDRLRRQPSSGQSSKPKPQPVTARYVFLCAGAVNTTELLYRSKRALGRDTAWQAALGSRYFPNADSLAAVFDCDEPHEADYGPTITAAMLYDQPAERGEFSCSIEFTAGKGKGEWEPVAGMVLTSSRNGTAIGSAILAHPPILDWGHWRTKNANGTLVLTEISAIETFNEGDTLTILSNGKEVARALARSGVRKQREWFLVQDGGYPTDVEPLVGVFRSSIWLRRNRYLEAPHQAGTPLPVPPLGVGHQPRARQAAPLRRPPTGRLRVEAFADALGGTSAAALRGDGLTMRSFAAGRGSAGPLGELLLPGLLAQPLQELFPPFFMKALRNDRMELLAKAAAVAIPTLSRILDDLSATVTKQLDPDTRERFSKQQVDDRQVEVLIRGLVRQVLQILAGSEVALATKAAQALLNPIPGTPGQALDLLASAALWAIGYNQNVGNTAVLLTMGRDNYRGRLQLKDQTFRVKLPTRLVDTTSATHERVLREIAMLWRGELRTNPGWTTLGQRVSVHSQGGCPMGEPGNSVTSAHGEVHGCNGLFVMDAAAFPTSVGVNPSATIAAVAEYKVEQFIRRHRSDWRARDHEQVPEWIARNGGAAAIDPLNSTGASKVTSRSAPLRQVDVLGLVFFEEMDGFCSPIRKPDQPIDFHRLSSLPQHLPRFVHAEDAGIADGRAPLSLRLCVKAPDLARLVAAKSELNPAKLSLTGKVSFQGSPPFTVDSDNSFLQMFVRSESRSDPRRFFRYHVEYGGGKYALDGVKVLDDAPGFDAWHDTATLYVQLTSPEGLQRGVLRLSIETFIRKQMPSMRITGTNDPARQSWALLAFYKYFASELSDIYMQRADAVKDALFKLVTSIHV
jgi:choline dehydrogenase-like flavoprotein